ncbi:MAG: histidine kinase N-terminal 7TM domain-containing protein [Vicinamibacterales bacterium]
MTWQPTLHAALLLAATGLAVWATVIVRSRRGVPGATSLWTLMLAIALWCLTSALHALTDPLPLRIAISKVQYIGIAAVPTLWFVFASEYARARWSEDIVLRVALWVLPVVTVLAAFTNEWHHLLWTSIHPAGDGSSRVVYEHGPWFVVWVVFTYCTLAGGAWAMLRSLRRYPLPRRRQAVSIVVGISLPWIANAVYISGLLPPGLDLTPVAFSLSGAVILWGLYRHRLLGLVPIARDVLVDSMEDGVLVLDQQRRIVDLNPAARRLTGCTEESIGDTIEDAVTWWTRAITERRSGAGLPALVAVGPEPRHLEVAVAPVRDSRERFTGWLVLLHDITHVRRAQAERQALDRRVQEQQRLESLSVLAGGVAHDFNNLLTGILGNADLLALSASPESPLRQSADAIVIGAQRAADLVAKMLAFAGEGRVMAQAVDLAELGAEMVDLLQASVARHCTLRYRSDPGLPAFHADATQLRQILLNLIINAAEASDEGGLVSVEIGVEPLTAGDLAAATIAGAVQPGPHVFIDVCDQGTGMDEATVARIFDPFFSTKATGRGLGLAAIQGIVRSYRGAIRVASTPGQGTRVRIWLPLVEGAEPGPDGTAAPATLGATSRATD